MIPNLRRRSEFLTKTLTDHLQRSKHYVPATEVVARYGPKAGFDGESLPPTEETFEEKAAFTIITPLEPSERGAQLSLLFLPPGRGVMERVFNGLKTFGVIGDERKPDVIRLGPTPLYSSTEDCARAAFALEQVFDELQRS